MSTASNPALEDASSPRPALVAGLSACPPPLCPPRHDGGADPSSSSRDPDSWGATCPPVLAPAGPNSCAPHECKCVRGPGASAGSSLGRTFCAPQRPTRIRPSTSNWPEQQGNIHPGSASEAGVRLGLQNRWGSAEAGARRVRFPCASAGTTRKRAPFRRRLPAVPSECRCRSRAGRGCGSPCPCARAKGACTAR
jgi:hypothetical protein